MRQIINLKNWILNKLIKKKTNIIKYITVSNTSSCIPTPSYIFRENSIFLNFHEILGYNLVPFVGTMKQSSKIRKITVVEKFPVPAENPLIQSWTKDLKKFESF